MTSLHSFAAGQGPRAHFPGRIARHLDLADGERARVRARAGERDVFNAGTPAADDDESWGLVYVKGKEKFQTQKQAAFLPTNAVQRPDVRVDCTSSLF